MRRLTLLLVAILILAIGSRAQPASAQSTSGNGEKLQFVVFLSRHGVRSPTGKAEQYQKFSASPWPEWPVQPGYLTPHGYQLMKIFGAYDRIQLATDGLLAPDGCADAV